MPSSSPKIIFSQPPSPRNLPFTINTTKVTLVMAMMALGMILCGSGLVIVKRIRKKKVDTSSGDETNQEVTSLEPRTVEVK